MEVWKAVAIEEYADTYEVSNTGRMRNIRTGKILRNAISSDRGYYHTHMSYKKKSKAFQVHRLVAMAFIGLPDEERNMVNHKDGNGKNNRVKNLEWVNHSENLLHRYRVLHCPPVRGAAKLTDEQVLEMRRLRSQGATYKELMDRFDICKSTISYIIKRKTWYHI